MRNKNLSGIIHLMPLLVIAGIMVLGLSFVKVADKTQSNGTQSVLSKSDENRSDSAEEVVSGKTNIDKTVKAEERTEKAIQKVEVKQERIELRTETKLRLATDEGELDEEEATDEGRIRVKNQEKFPLSINPETGELTVTTPAGTKVVTILPDAAVENMLLKKKINIVTSVEMDTDEEGELEYEVEGYEEQKLFGIFKVKVGRKFRVAADTGEETEEETGLVNELLDLFSV